MKISTAWAAWPGHCALAARGIRQPTRGSHLGSMRVTAGWCGVLSDASSMRTAHRGGNLEFSLVKGCIPKRSAQSALGEGQGGIPCGKELIKHEVPGIRYIGLSSAL